ncbi:MAG: ABC transporter permease [Streptosporangiaceae bacterium]
MTRFLIRRFLQALVVLFGLTLVVFLLIHLLPGGAARALLGPRASAPAVRAFEIANGYNKPLVIQYLDYLGRLAHGNLGFSYHYNESVSALLAQDAPKTVLLVGLATLIAVAAAIPLGLLQASRRNRAFDHVATSFAFVGYSMPVFWVGIVLIQFFAVDIKALPPEAPQGTTLGAVLSQPSALVLPVLTLAIVTTALFSRFMRASAIEALIQDYTRTARSKGASQRRVLSTHVLRNALLPVITLIGLSLPGIVSGVILVESVFNYPGMGLLLWNAASVHDFPVLMACALVAGAATVLGSLLADVLYAVADPRIRY